MDEVSHELEDGKNAGPTSNGTTESLLTKTVRVIPGVYCDTDGHPIRLATKCLDVVAKDRNGIVIHLSMPSPAGPPEMREGADPAVDSPRLPGYAVHAGSESTSPDFTPMGRANAEPDVTPSQDGLCGHQDERGTLSVQGEEVEVVREPGPHDYGGEPGVSYDAVEEAGPTGQ